MMKRIIFLVFLTCFLPGIGTVKSQEPAVRDEINFINSLLKANPYRDTFLEITFFYSIDITSDKDFVVNMDFDGPFKTILKAKIIDLGGSFLRDTAYEGNSSICWYCKTDDTTIENNCVYNETITSGLENEFHYSDNICVMFARDSNIRDELIKLFDKLFKRVLEQ
jgi:hypothetical protein